MEVEHERHNFTSLESCWTPLVPSDVQVPRKEQRKYAVGINRNE